MIPVAFIVLAIFILTVLNDRPVIVIVLAGLLVFIWGLLSKTTNLKKLIIELEGKFSILFCFLSFEFYWDSDKQGKPRLFR